MAVIPAWADHFFFAQVLLFQLTRIHEFLGIFFLILQQEILLRYGFLHLNFHVSRQHLCIFKNLIDAIDRAAANLDTL